MGSSTDAMARPLASGAAALNGLDGERAPGQDERVLLLITLGLVLMYLVWLGRGEPMLTRAEWRMGAGMGAIGCAVAAAFLVVRGQWEIAVGLLAVAATLLFAARSRTMAQLDWRAIIAGRPQPPPSKRDLSLAEARAVLGVSETATAAEIRAAYARLMRRAHPDHGGTVGLAAQLNAARDRLLKRR
jgi:hypothetical protein